MSKRGKHSLKKEVSDASRLWLRVRMLSDWHVGSGRAAQGDVDAFTARDAAGFPCIPAATMRGILRDAAEQAAFALDADLDDKPWAKFVTRLFGSEPGLSGRQGASPADAPVEGLLRVDAAELTGVVKAKLNSERLKAATTFIKPGVSIDPDTGTARDQMHLRIEVARKGADLFAPLSFEGPTEVVAQVSAFLQIAAALATSVGAKRRRGLGRCEMVLMTEHKKNGIQEVPLNDLETRLRSSPLALPEFVRHTAAPSILSKTNQMRRHLFTVEVRSPVVVAPIVEANVITGADYISGSVLLPVFARSLRAANREKSDAIDTAISQGRLRVLPAYPQINGKRTVPLPLGFQTPKENHQGSEHGLRDTFDENTLSTDTQMKAIRTGFVCNDPQPGGVDTFCYLERVRKVAFTHNSIADDTQRPAASGGGVYVLEGIAPGQVFAGELHFDQSLDLKLAHLNTLDARIGRARNRGYGAINLQLGGNGGFCKSKLGQIEKGKTLSVVFESDAIIEGVFDLASLVSAMALQDFVDLEQSHASIRTKIVDGWIGSWQLPRGGMSAIQAGSRLKLKLKNDLPAKHLKDIEETGFGARRAEGFGQVGFDTTFSTAAKNLRKQRAPDSMPYPAYALDEKCEDFISSANHAAWAVWAKSVAESFALNRGHWTHLGLNIGSLGGIREIRGQLENLRRTKNIQGSVFETLAHHVKERCARAEKDFVTPMPNSQILSTIELIVLSICQLLQRELTDSWNQPTSPREEQLEAVVDAKPSSLAADQEIKGKE